MKKIVKWYNNLRFKFKLLVSFLLIGCLPLISWGCFSIFQTSQFLKVQAEKNFDNIFENTVRSLDNKFSQVENAISFIAENKSITQILSKQYESPYEKYEDMTVKLDSLIWMLQNTHPEIEYVRVYASGNVQGTRMNIRGLDEIPEDYFDMPKDPFFTNWASTEGKIIAAQQLMDFNTHMQAGLVEVFISQDMFFNDILPQPYDDYVCTISDQSGNIMYPRELGESQDKPMLYVRSKEMETNGWKVEMSFDTELISNPPNKMLTTLIIFIGISFAFLLAMILAFTRLIDRRVSELNDQLSHIARSDFRINISSAYNDEIGEIANNVGKMVKESRSMVEEVYESKIMQKEAEIKALQSQINPHFLYNTLSAINWTAIRSGNMEISQITTNLSTFYRNTLNKGDNITTVRKELGNTRAYLDIRLAINKDAFEVNFDIEPQVLDYNMPNIILQPIVENAIDHGLSQKSSGRGRLNIKVWEEDEKIIFVIEDNGVGMSDLVAAQLPYQDTKGYGVKNVNDRLALFFNRSDALHFASREGEGTKAKISIPKYIHWENSEETP